MFYQWTRCEQASIIPVKNDSHFDGADSNKLTARNLREEHATV